MPKGLKFYHIETYIYMFTVSLVTIVREWSQPRYLLTDECMKKLQYVYTMELYATINKNGIITVVGK